MIQRIDEFRGVFESKGIELVIPEFIQSLSEEKLLDLVPTVDGWIIGDDPATKNIFEAGKRGKLKAAVKWGVGVDNVDIKAAERLGISISNTPKMFGNEVADLGICYLLSLARSAHFIDREVRKGLWVKPAGVSVTGKTIALVGLGDIGLACARRLKGFDVKILGYDPFTSLNAFEAGVDQILEFPEKLNEADFILITCALTKDNIHLINKRTIAEMKDAVFIINISRGKLINEVDLAEALESGKIKGAALDVFEMEPLDIESPLRSFQQCIFGTHNGSNTVEAVKRATEQSMTLLFGYLNLL